MEALSPTTSSESTTACSWISVRSSPSTGWCILIGPSFLKDRSPHCIVVGHSHIFKLAILEQHLVVYGDNPRLSSDVESDSVKANIVSSDQEHVLDDRWPLSRGCDSCYEIACLSLSLIWIFVGDITNKEPMVGQSVTVGLPSISSKGESLIVIVLHSLR